MRLGKTFLNWVELDKFFVAQVGSNWVSHFWFESKFGKFPLKIPNFSIFSLSGQTKSLQVGSKSTGVKDRSASYLLQVKSMLGSGQGLSLVHSTIDFGPALRLLIMKSLRGSKSSFNNVWMNTPELKQIPFSKQRYKTKPVRKWNKWEYDISLNYEMANCEIAATY